MLLGLRFGFSSRPSDISSRIKLLYNKMCNTTATSGKCGHPECQLYLAQPSMCLSPAMLHYFTFSVMETTALLRQIVQNNCKIPSLISTIVQTLEEVPSPIARKSTVILPVRVLHDMIVHPQAYQFAYMLELDTPFPTDLCKGREFEVILRLLGEDHLPFAGMVGSKYRALLYTNEPEMRPQELSIMGQKALKGTTEAVCGTDASVRFPNLIINELSSHYCGNGLALAVVCLNSTQIKPYVQKQVNVRANRQRQRH